MKETVTYTFAVSFRVSRRQPRGEIEDAYFDTAAEATDQARRWLEEFMPAYPAQIAEVSLTRVEEAP